MKVHDTPLPECKLIEPAVFGDARGSFFESWNRARLSGKILGRANWDVCHPCMPKAYTARRYEVRSTRGLRGFFRKEMEKQGLGALCAEEFSDIV